MPHPVNKHERVLCERKETNNICQISTFHYHPYAGYPREAPNGGVYIRHKSRSGARRFLKRRSTRAARRNPMYFQKGNRHKRHYDLWWELY